MTNYTPTQAYEKAIEKLAVDKLNLESTVELQSQLIDQIAIIINTPDIADTFKVILARRHINDYNARNQESITRI